MAGLGRYLVYASLVVSAAEGGLAMTNVSFTKDGSIEVHGAPLPFMSDYFVQFGDVLLTVELAEEGRKYGWHAYGKPESGLIRASRTEKDYWERYRERYKEALINALPNV
jgi:hypothetical protein